MHSDTQAGEAPGRNETRTLMLGRQTISNALLYGSVEIMDLTILEKRIQMDRSDQMPLPVE